MTAQDTTPGRSRLETRSYPHHATSTVTQHVVDRARATILRNAKGDSHEAKVADARELMAMLDLVEPTNLFDHVDVGDTSTMGAAL